MEYENELQKARREKGVLIAAHRGVSGGNIPFNTIQAFEAALAQGADMLETDVTVSADGELFVFHPSQERKHLNLDIHLEQMTGKEIRELRYVNFDRAATEYHLPSLEEFLETYKGRCFINLDHGWDCLPEMTRLVRRHGMERQVLIKAPAKLTYAQQMEALAPDMMFMPIYKEKDELTGQLEQMNLNFVGAEVVFASEDSPLASEEYIRRHHERRRVLWCNAILYSYKSQLSGGHTDDVAVTGSPDHGWGWILDRGFDIIQTDWVLPLKQYLADRTGQSERRITINE